MKAVKRKRKWMNAQPAASEVAGVVSVSAYEACCQVCVCMHYVGDGTWESAEASSCQKLVEVNGIGNGEWPEEKAQSAEKWWAKLYEYKE